MGATLDLSGAWTVRLDPEDAGVREHWELQQCGDPVHLPGSLDQNGIGTPNDEWDGLSGLARRVRYVGPAWYTRTVEIPPELRGRPLRLTLERVHWFGDVWIDGRHVGGGESLSVPHRFDVGPLAGPSVRVAFRIDNTPKIPIGRICHALTDWTQTNWNGVAGAMTLEAVDGEAFTDLRVHANENSIEVSGRCVADGRIEASANGARACTEGVAGAPFSVSVPLQGERWDDGAPALTRVTVQAGSHRVEREVGLRSIRTDGKRILLNGRPLFLRGTLENCVFPKTGYPPTEVEPWARIMARAREFGLNHIRFHSWCPPEAAFVAADHAGVVLQVETPLWTGTRALSSDPSLLGFCEREARRILSEYGHHPSFALFALGNEMAFFGEEPEVDRLLADLKRDFPNRLYTHSSHGTHLGSACDYYVQADNGRPGAENKPLRGSTWFGVGSRFDREAPGTRTTCDEASAQFDRPVVSHEVGEWAVFPDVHHAERYDGVLEARNFDAIRRMLGARGMEGLSRAFTEASGKLSAMLYKEEVETLMRTQGLAGFQLLGLTDFPGQGTATVGMLDAFWGDKGFVRADDFRAHCGPCVPLLACNKAVWHTGERYEADASIHHCGRQTPVEARWRVLDASRRTILEGSLGAAQLAAGESTPVGRIAFGLEGMEAPGRYEIELEAVGLGTNRWPFWVFPESLEDVDPGVPVVSRYWDEARGRLRAGEAVWLRVRPEAFWGGVPGRFAPAFWSPVHFKEQVGTMGTLIDAAHPAFGRFPTASHTEWHWWDVLTASKALPLDALPKAFRPTLQVIDRYDRNLKLGTIFEARVGTGRLFATLIDFDRLEGRLAARQLRHSIAAYLSSTRFGPSQEVSFDDLDRAFEPET